VGQRQWPGPDPAHRHGLGAAADRLPLGPPRTLAFDNQGRLVMILGRRGLARWERGKLTIWDGRQIGFERPGSLTVRANDVLVGGTTGLLRLTDKGMQVLDVADHPWLFDTRGIIATGNGTTWLLGYRGLSRVATAALDGAFAAPRRPIPHTTFDDDDRRIARPSRARASRWWPMAAAACWRSPAPACWKRCPGPARCPRRPIGCSCARWR
jgi:hypothetical protein